MTLSAMQGRSKEDLVDDAVRYLWRHGTPITATRKAQGPIAVSGSGIRITDIDGNTYLDGLGGGSAAATIGYGQQEVADAVAQQLSKLHYASVRTYLNEPAIELARRIAEVAPGDLATSFFTSSGSEAVETAAQIIKAYHKKKGQPEKSKVIYRTTGFHGVSLIAASASASPDYRDWFQPLVPGFVEVPTCYTYRRPEGQSVEEYAASCAQAIEDEILRQGPETVGAIFAESIPAGLILPPPASYLKRLREICDQYDIVWLDDEVFIGFGRTGRYFGCEHYDVVPDIVTASKGITGGYVPLGAAIVSQSLMEVLVDDGAAGQAKVHGHTYSGHAGACAAGLAVLDILARDRLVENVARLGDKMLSAFREFGAEHPHVGDVRGKGFLIGIELVEDKATRKPFPAEAGIGRGVVAAAMKEKFMLRSARDVVAQSGGFEIGDIITLFPSFIATEDEVDEMIRITKQAITESCGA
ncbi:aspartate aminotransferase family protein [Georgenia sp. AZ-5]|uniref:aminotransferase family protein n=1 Tax=Georgenia sp. AZ-5 TaxID=3367526 RepID=UPI003754029F